MSSSNRLLKSKFGLSILLTAITFSLLIAGLAISGQPVTQASEITDKKNGIRPCKIDPKDMKASPGAPPPPFWVKRVGASFDEGGGLPCLDSGCTHNLGCVEQAHLSPAGGCAMKCCWDTFPWICSEPVDCDPGEQ